ncbi:efflux RND transporter periplasmic adaptor subunit [Niveispirillum fermenti]|uniref:efflux RND transporter periplasmic adaptor subunit n=1 Tax=Niveispirillum fermenti TaxID=1233113 RepID=UPI003A87C599
MTATDPRDRQLTALAGLVQMERRVRAAATAAELAFLMVNETHALVPYRQAVLWRADTGGIQAMSGLAIPDEDAPFNRWLGRLMAQWVVDAKRGPRLLDADDLPAEEGAAWAEHLPAHALLLPLFPPAGGEQAKPVGLLLLARDEPFMEPDRQLLDLLGDAYGHAWHALTRRTARRWRWIKDRKRLAMIAGAALLLLLFPVRQSVLAPAEIVPLHPAVLRAPIAGVVEGILVQPNEPVTEGQPLVQMDARELESRLEVARQALAVADAEQRQAQQQAVFDERAKASLAILASRREQAVAEAAFLEETLGRGRLTAPKAGIAIYDNPDDWAGRPVSLGERILTVADPAAVELEIHLGVGDAITLEPGARISFFLNIDPAAPLSATLLRAGYRAAPTPEGTMAYRLTGRFIADSADDKQRLRVGLRGTAKLEGRRTVLALYLLRRPLAALRLWLGW